MKARDAVPRAGSQAVRNTLAVSSIITLIRFSFLHFSLKRWGY